MLAGHLGDFNELMLAGTLWSARSASVTVTLKLVTEDDGASSPSLAVQVTMVMPTGNVAPEL